MRRSNEKSYLKIDLNKRPALKYIIYVKYIIYNLYIIYIYIYIIYIKYIIYNVRNKCVIVGIIN